ncbi:MAG: 2-oxoacid:ferredoxin oxidoreductase subunit beta [Rhodocyclales bacterium]|nr:2-oxoacid:ferredoxin oxidoreductase subunit beta [Rhodocyclales bacterium]
MTDMTVATPVQALTKKDFESGLDVRWCPGCGDYAVLSQITKLMPKLGIPRENFAFVSGIGCSSRFPYYVQTYGLHTIHGRALAIATGLKISRPDLSVWVVTGDGDALASGGNHFIHAVRRNIGLKVILLNNRIYGLTKGQYSPTSELGKKTKTSPLGNIDQPFSPVALALGAGATFAARCIDGDQAMMAAILERAAKHEGTAFVEILQNCVVFNDGAFDALSDKATRDDTRLVMEHGKPLIFGKERNKGIRLSGMDMEVVTIGENGVTEADILVHNENAAHSGLAFSLGQFESPDFPVPFGVFRDVDKPSYESLSQQLSESARAAKGRGDLQRLLNSGETWTIK